MVSLFELFKKKRQNTSFLIFIMDRFTIFAAIYPKSRTGASRTWGDNPRNSHQIRLKGIEQSE